MMEQIRHENPTPPRQHRPDVSPLIEQICLKCLRKNHGERYATAQELAQAVRGYLNQVGYARNFTTMGTLFIGLAPVILAINLTVYFLLQSHVWEPVIWTVMFAMYPALYGVFLLAPAQEAGQANYLSRVELWSIWGAKLFAAVSISIALRVAFWDELGKALVLVYPVFAALSGMAVFVMVAKMPRILYFVPAATWLTGIAMVFHLEWAPILYGICALLGLLLYGLYLRKLGMELS